MPNSTFQVRTRFSAFSVRQSAVTLSLLFILFLLVLSQAANTVSATQASTLSSPSIEWQHTYGLGISQAIQTSDGGFALTGSIPLNPSFVGYPWLLKTDSQGNDQWNQSYTKYPDLNLAGVGPIIQATDGGYLLGGSFSDLTAYLLKTDSKGNVEWIRSYPSREYVGDLIKTPVGGYVISGPYRNGTACWLAKVDSTGAVQWSCDYMGVFIYRIVQANDGGYAMIGEAFASNGLRAATLIKTDSEGKMIWSQTYGSSIQFIRLVKTADGGYALAGNTFQTNSSQGAVLLTKTDSLGNVVWNQTYSQLGEETVWSIAKTSDGGYALGCGGTFIGDFAKVDAAGNLQWNISFGFDSNVRSVMQLGDGSYVFLAGNALIKTVSDVSLPSVTPTKTIPDISTSINPSPTPTVPEFSWVTILPLSLFLLTIAVLITKEHDK